MIKARLGDRLDAWLKAALPFLFRRPLDPNTLTVMGTLVSLGASVAFGLGEFEWAGVLVLAGGAFDLVDGVIARHHGTTSAFGAFLDSTLDRLVDMTLVIGIAVHYASEGLIGHLLLASWALVACVLVSYAKARAERWVPQVEGGLLERGERIGLLAIGAILDLMVPVLWVIGVLGTYTVVQRMIMAHRQMSRLSAEAPPPRPADDGRAGTHARSGNGSAPHGRGVGGDAGPGFDS
jgi:phosphatidylglycerophosphate synthase